MSILINLLPDLRQAKLRERRRRQTVSGISVAIWIVCGGVVILLLAYSAGQKVIISRDTNSINSEKQQLAAVPGLLDAYTAEQHLASLPGLYSQRVHLSKFFQSYQAADPTTVSLASLSVDSQNTLTVSGEGTNYASVAKLARAMAASNVTVGPGAAASNAPNFNGVSITTANSDGSGHVEFTITATISSGAVSGGK